MSLSQATGLPVAVIWEDLQSGVLQGIETQGKTKIRVDDLLASKRDRYRLVAENIGRNHNEAAATAAPQGLSSVRPLTMITWSQARKAVYRGEMVKVSAWDVMREDRLISLVSVPVLSRGMAALTGFAGPKGSRPVFILGPDAKIEHDVLTLRLQPQIAAAFPAALKIARQILSQLDEQPQEGFEAFAQLVLDYGTRRVEEWLSLALQLSQHPSTREEAMLAWRTDGTMRTPGGIFYQWLKHGGYWSPEAGSGSSQAVFRGEVLPLRKEVAVSSGLARAARLPIESIYIPPRFRQTCPRAHKLARVRALCAQGLDKPLLVKAAGPDQYLLVDGYLRYLVAEEFRLQEVPVRLI